MVKEVRKCMNPEQHLSAASDTEFGKECKIHGIVTVNGSLNWT